MGDHHEPEPHIGYENSTQRENMESMYKVYWNIPNIFCTVYPWLLKIHLCPNMHVVLYACICDIYYLAVAGIQLVI